MFRRSAATQDARSNSLLSLPSTITSTNNLSATSNATDEEAHLQDNTANEKPTTSKKKLNPFSKGQKQQRIVPTRKATPDQIRAYFTKLLTEHDALLADDAAKCESIVSAWKIGGGVEMRQYGPAMYLELFGREYGWILYREVRMSIRKETNFLVRRPLYSFVASSFLLEVVTITLLVHVDGMDEGVEVVVILASVVGMLTLLVSLIILCAGSSPARLIERDLRACTKGLSVVKG